MDQNEGFALTRKVLEKGYSDKTKAVIITTPSNPTGIVMDESPVSYTHLDVYKRQAYRW